MKDKLIKIIVDNFNQELLNRGIVLQGDVADSFYPEMEAILVKALNTSFDQLTEIYVQS